MTDLTIRGFVDGDAEAAALVFFASVREGTRAHYSIEQRLAWATNVPETSSWRDRLNAQSTFVALRNDTLVGFMTIAPDGYIDLAFVAPNEIGNGVGKRLYDAVETEAATLGVTRLHTQASHLARPFFLRQGWSVVNQQSVSRNGVAIVNFIIEKSL